jgi:hypothetical protein
MFNGRAYISFEQIKIKNGSSQFLPVIVRKVKAYHHFSILHLSPL